MLTLTFLGVGSAYAKRNFQSNALLEAWSVRPDERAGRSLRSQTASAVEFEVEREPEDTLLIDFGTTGPLALHQLKDRPTFDYLNARGTVNYPAIRRILITHLHSDHVGGLEELAGVNAHYHVDPVTGRGFRPQLVSVPELLDSLWEHCLKGGLGVFAGREATLDDYFSVFPIAAFDPGDGPHADALILADRYCISPFRTDHIRLRSRFDWRSLGVHIADLRTGRSVLYSGDTRFDSQRLGPLMRNADVIFHEVQLDECPPKASTPRAEADPPDSASAPTGRPISTDVPHVAEAPPESTLDYEPVHALLSQLRTLPAELKRKMFLYHYADAFDRGEFDFVAAEFAGFAVPQQRYLLFAD